MRTRHRKTSERRSERAKHVKRSAASSSAKRDGRRGRGMVEGILGRDKRERKDRRLGGMVREIE